MKLGLRANAAQFSLLVLVNGLVGAMVGMERSVLPAMAEARYDLIARTAVLSFIVVFGLSKAFANLFAGGLADRWGRKSVLVGGWLLATPVPFLLMVAPTWGVVLGANLLLGVSQGLTWSSTVIMKIDLAGPKQRGLAMGLNEFAGYLAVGLSALATGWVAGRYGLGAAPFVLGVVYVALGLGLSAWVVRETQGHVDLEQAQGSFSDQSPGTVEVLRRTTLSEPTLSASCQAGLVNNLNDGMAWGLFPFLYAAAGLSLASIGLLAAIYPAVWGIGQLVTGPLSDRTGRKPLIVAGMWVQAGGLAVTATGTQMAQFAAGAALLGLGTAMVYPTQLAAIGDVAPPLWRGSAVGVYRFWRDMGYAVGALLAGLVADALGLGSAVWAVAALTAASGVVVAVRMPRRVLREDADRLAGPDG